MSLQQGFLLINLRSVCFLSWLMGGKHLVCLPCDGHINSPNVRQEELCNSPQPISVSSCLKARASAHERLEVTCSVRHTSCGCTGILPQSIP
ncbi:hypothetical protein B0H14DRAFT_2829120 [Mycena olivaceomarginata]|nr:hypothetical protein B0H14DRAFT_2829120 [Mycena olivaceomarginata]